MEKNRIIGYAIVFLVVLLVVVGYISGRPGSKKNMTKEQTSPTRSEVPSGIVVPDQNATNTPKDIAVPKVSIPAAPGVTSLLRVFDIKAEKGVFSPSTVTAYVGDVIHVNFTAVDKGYDITFPDYGMKQVAGKGETKVLEFQAGSSGKFTYYCNSCGGLDSQTKGYIIIVPKT